MNFNEIKICGRFICRHTKHTHTTYTSYIHIHNRINKINKQALTLHSDSKCMFECLYNTYKHIYVAT